MGEIINFPKKFIQQESNKAQSVDKSSAGDVLNFPIENKQILDPEEERKFNSFLESIAISKNTNDRTLPSSKTKKEKFKIPIKQYPTRILLDIALAATMAELTENKNNHDFYSSIAKELVHRFKENKQK